MLYNQINPIDISKYIIKYVSKFKSDVNHLKLQKLLYYVDAWHLATFEMPLFKENFEAWVHGPVIREVWDYYKSESVLNGILQPKEMDFQLDDILSEEQIQLINDVLDEYGQKSPYHLECLTHDELPWQEARRGYSWSDHCEEKISKKTMQSFYSEMAYG